MNKKNIINLVFALAVLVVGIFFFQGGFSSGGSTGELNLEQALEQVKADSNIILLDVRTPQEYADGHVELAINLPLQSLPEYATQILPDKEQKIFVYCRSGNRSSQAKAYLDNQGYSQIIDVGGIKSYKGKLVK